MVKLKKFLAKILPLLVVLLFTFPTIRPLLRLGTFPMHDDISLMRQDQMDKCFADGQIPCRWIPDMGFGYGYPQFNYYGPLPYYLSSLFRLVGLPVDLSVNFTFALALVLGNLTMFLLGRSLFGTWGGVLSTLAYAYSPYRASDLYSRGAMGETWAFVFMPLILYSAVAYIRLPRRKNLALFAVSTSFLLTTHNITTLIFTPLAAIWTLAFLYFTATPQKIRVLLKLFLGGLWAVALAAFFFLPVVFESRLAHTESLLAGYFNYLAHFLTLKQLFLSTFWGFGSSEIGFTDDLSFFFGPVHLLLGLLALALSIYHLYRRRRSPLPLLVIVSFFLFLLSALLTHNQASFIYQNLKFLAYLQFPWRFLVTGNFFLCLIAGYLLTNLPPRTARVLIAVFATLLLLFNLAFFRPLRWLDQTLLEKFSGNSWEKQQTVSIFDYLPKSAQFPPGKPAPRLPQITPSASVLDYRSGSNDLSFTTVSQQPAQVQLPLIDFPTWKVRVDDQPVASRPTTELGLVTFDLPVGTHKIDVQLHNSPIRTLGNLLSLVTIIFTLLVLRSKDEV